MALQALSLAKPGETPSKLTLNLAKPARFTAELYWDSAHDLDGHALLATNNGSGAKVTAFEQVLSTYNCKKTNPNGTLPVNPDGKSFQTPEGALIHSGDATTGVNSNVDEIITINGANVPATVNEIPIFITIHHLSSPAKFAEVKDAGIRIKDDSGRVLGEYQLTNQFAEFDAVQMGSFVLDDSGWHFMEVAVGFHGDFNTVLSSFS